MKRQKTTLRGGLLKSRRQRMIRGSCQRRLSTTSRIASTRFWTRKKSEFKKQTRINLCIWVEQTWTTMTERRCLKCLSRTMTRWGSCLISSPATTLIQSLQPLKTPNNLRSQLWLRIGAVPRRQSTSTRPSNFNANKTLPPWGSVICPATCRVTKGL